MLYAVAEQVLTVPYKLNGFDPLGWDCRGCVSWGRNRWLGLTSPGMDGYYPAEQGTDLAFVERLMSDRMDKWLPAKPGPGVVALFEVRGRVAHVGLMLDRKNFIHARQGYNTCVDTLESKKWSRRLRGTYEL